MVFAGLLVRGYRLTSLAGVLAELKIAALQQPAHAARASLTQWWLGSWPHPVDMGHELKRYAPLQVRQANYQFGATETVGSTR